MKGISRAELSEIGKSSTMGATWRGPIELYGAFVELAQQAFSDSGFSEKKWNSDEKKSDIYIIPDYVWDDQNVEKRPAVYVSLGDINCEPFAPQIGRPGEMGMNLRGERGAEHYFRDIKSGTVSWNVLAESRGESLSIVSDLAKYLNVFQSRIRVDLCMKTFAVTQISPLNIVKESRERFQCSVTATFSYEFGWTLVEEAPKARIDLHITEVT